MIKFSKKVEYALLSLSKISKMDGGLISAKELSSELKIEFEFLSKILQQLKSSGIVISKKGKGGGYELAKPLSELSLMDTINILENGQSMNIVNCLDENDNCFREKDCSMRKPFQNLQARLYDFLGNISVAEFLKINN